MPDICNSQMFKLINTSFTVQTGTTTHSGVVFPPGASSIKTGRHGSPSPSLIPVHRLLYFRDLPLILGFSISRRLVTMKAHVLVKNTVKCFLCTSTLWSHLILSYFKASGCHFFVFILVRIIFIAPRPVPKCSRHVHCTPDLSQSTLDMPTSAPISLTVNQSVSHTATNVSSRRWLTSRKQVFRHSDLQSLILAFY